MSSCRLAVAILVPLLLAGGLATGATSSSNGCSRALPGAMPRLPAAVVVTTRCGRFRLEPGGGVAYKGSTVLPVPRGASYWPADLTWYRFARGRLLIGRGHRLLWRSRRRYPRSYPGNVGSVALGRNALAYSYYGTFSQPPHLYVAHYGAAEHRVAAGESPLAFLRSGELATLRDSWHTLVVRNARWRFERVVARHVSDPQWDRVNRNVLFRLRDRLFVFDGARIRGLVRLEALGVRGLPVVEPLGRVIAAHSRRKLVVIDLDGRVVASTQLPSLGPGDGVSSAVVVDEPGTAVAFAVTTVSATRETVYVLSAGGRQAIPLFSHDLVPQGCGRSADLAWHGRWLLYSTSEQRVAVIDSKARAATIDLSAVIARLPGVRRDGFFDVAWAR